MKPETQIKNMVMEAKRRVSQKIDTFVTGRNDFERTCVSIESGYGTIQVVMIPHTRFTKSYYRVQHPTLGTWEGALNGLSSQLGDYGVRIGTPRRIP
jgi:hypothetical protein